jgi:hypothetical protein
MEDSKDPLPPQVQAQMEQMQQTIEQLTQALEDSMDSSDKAKAEAATSNAEAEQDRVALEALKVKISEYEAETDRMAKLGSFMTPEQVQQMVLQTIAGLATSTDIDPGNGAYDQGGGAEGGPLSPPDALPALDPVDEMPAEPSMAMEVGEPEEIQVDPRQLQLMPPGPTPDGMGEQV